MLIGVCLEEFILANYDWYDSLDSTLLYEIKEFLSLLELEEREEFFIFLSIDRFSIF